MTAATPDRAALHAFVAKHGKILLTTHVNPDGDAIGSELAFARWLQGMGKQVRILNDSPTPPAFAWLLVHHAIELYDESLAESCFEWADALVVLDTGNRSRIGRLSDHLDRHLVPIAVVDHHATHDGFGSVNVIEPAQASASSLVYDLVRESGATIDRAMADALYVGLSTDTGNFKYSNTDAAAHRMAAELVSLGVEPQVVHLRVNATAPAGRLRFFGEVLAKLQVLENGRVIVIEASPDQFERHGLVGADTEGLVDMPRAIAGVEVVMLVSEVKPGKIKVSLRSMGRVSIDQVVARLGGGGHAHAAGAQLVGTREDAKAKILPELAKLLVEWDEKTGASGADGAAGAAAGKRA